MVCFRLLALGAVLVDADADAGVGVDIVVLGRVEGDDFLPSSNGRVEVSSVDVDASVFASPPTWEGFLSSPASDDALVVSVASFSLSSL
jgi:hypothetical protein